MKKKTLAEIRKKFSKKSDSLTLEECARLHQSVCTQVKLLDIVKKNLASRLIIESDPSKPFIVNHHKLTVVRPETAPKITWEAVVTSDLVGLIGEEEFLACGVISQKIMEAKYPTLLKKVKASDYVLDNTTEAAPYVKWYKNK